MKNVYIITGAPGSGKSTYVKKHKKDNDLVVDLDYICAALQLETNVHRNHDSVLKAAICIRDSLYPFIANRWGDWCDCWIITAEADTRKLKDLESKVRATDTIEINVPVSECLRRIEKEQSRTMCAEDFKELARKWHNKHNRPPYSKF